MPILHFGTPAQKVGRVETDTEEIGRNEAELTCPYSDNADDDAIHSCDDPALPQFLPDEHCREDGQ